MCRWLVLLVALVVVVCYTVPASAQAGNADEVSVLEPVAGDPPAGGDCYWPAEKALPSVQVRIVKRAASWTKNTAATVCHSAACRAVNTRAKVAAIARRPHRSVGK